MIFIKKKYKILKISMIFLKYIKKNRRPLRGPNLSKLYFKKIGASRQIYQKKTKNIFFDKNLSKKTLGTRAHLWISHIILKLIKGLVQVPEMKLGMRMTHLVVSNWYGYSKLFLCAVTLVYKLLEVNSSIIMLIQPLFNLIPPNVTNL